MFISLSLSMRTLATVMRTSVFACCIVVLSSANTVRAADDEAKLKAAFVYHFSQLVEWPGETPQKIVVGIIGNDTLREALADLIAQKDSGDSPVSVQEFATIEDAIERAHVLVVGATQADNVVQIIEAVAGRPILTVSEIESFAGSGGVIGFVRRGTRQKFEVNLAAADSAGLQLKSQLLQVAILVD